MQLVFVNVYKELIELYNNWFDRLFINLVICSLFAIATYFGSLERDTVTFIYGIQIGLLLHGLLFNVKVSKVTKGIATTILAFIIIVVYLLYQYAISFGSNKEFELYFIAQVFCVYSGIGAVIGFAIKAFRSTRESKLNWILYYVLMLLSIYVVVHFQFLHLGFEKVGATSLFVILLVINDCLLEVL